MPLWSLIHACIIFSHPSIFFISLKVFLPSPPLGCSKEFQVSFSLSQQNFSFLSAYFHSILHHNPFSFHSSFWLLFFQIFHLGLLICTSSYCYTISGFLFLVIFWGLHRISLFTAVFPFHPPPSYLIASPSDYCPFTFCQCLLNTHQHFPLPCSIFCGFPQLSSFSFHPPPSL